MSDPVKKWRSDVLPEMNRLVFLVEKVKKCFVTGKGSIEEHLSEATKKLADHQGSVAKSLQSAANHVDSVEDSFIGSLKAFEFEKDRLIQTLADRKRHAFKPEHEVSLVLRTLALVPTIDHRIKVFGKRHDKEVRNSHAEIGRCEDSKAFS